MAVTKAAVGVRLPRTGEFTLPLGGIAAGVVLRPWFDWIAVRVIAHWYFPVSRGWAAALAAGGDVARFQHELPVKGLDGGRLSRALAKVDRRRRDYESAERAWDRVFFSDFESPAQARVAAELARHDRAHALMATRAAFLPFRRRLPAMKWEVPAPAVVANLHGARLMNPELAFPAPAPTEIAVSQAVPGSQGPERWLRFASPVFGDTAWAHVYEGEGRGERPTFIYLHGIAMENEMWRGHASPIEILTRRGFRVICAEGPWHGRRRLPGAFGGEPIIGRAPLGFLDLLHAWVSEVAVLIGWARRSGHGPVVLGGVSLGALTSQVAASAAADWPQNLRPDALFLVATSAKMLDVALSGTLTRGLGLPRRLEEAGWSERELARWLPLLEPTAPPPIPPERLFLLLGRSDDLTPYEGGLALAQAWHLPERNVFVRPQGHFSVSLGLLQDSWPLDRLVESLDRG